MIKAASDVMNSIGKWMSDNPTAATALLTGGVGALGGFALTGSKEGESTSDTMKRRLKNALLVGGLAGGGGAAISYGLNQINTALPDDAKQPGDSMWERWLSTLGFGGAGAAGGAKIGKNITNRMQSKDIMAAASQLGLKSKDAATARKEIQNLINSGHLSEDTLAKAFGVKISRLDTVPISLKIQDLTNKEALKIAKKFGYELHDVDRAKNFLNASLLDQEKAMKLAEKLGITNHITYDVKSLESLGDKLKRFGFKTPESMHAAINKGNKGFKFRGRAGGMIGGALSLAPIAAWLGNNISAKLTNDSRSLLDDAKEIINKNTL